MLPSPEKNLQEQLGTEAQNCFLLFLKPGTPKRSKGKPSFPLEHPEGICPLAASPAHAQQALSTPQILVGYLSCTASPSMAAWKDLTCLSNQAQLPGFGSFGSPQTSSRTPQGLSAAKHKLHNKQVNFSSPSPLPLTRDTNILLPCSFQLQYPKLSLCQPTLQKVSSLHTTEVFWGLPLTFSHSHSSLLLEKPPQRILPLFLAPHIYSPTYRLNFTLWLVPSQPPFLLQPSSFNRFHL